MRKKLLILSLIAALLCVFVPTALAHTTTEVSGYSLITGWLVEPAIVGERNTIYIEIWQGDAMVSYQDMRLNAAFLYDDERKPIRLVQGSDKGRYTITYVPTAAGEYRIHLFGSLGDESVDIEVAPESVGEATIIQFPDSVLSGKALQDGLIGIEEQIASLRTLAMGGIASGIIGILIALFALRKRSQ